MRILEKILGRQPHWGVHPDDHKRPAADAPLRSLPLPEVLRVPLQQHVGSPARPVVLVGERVLKGDLIAEPNGNISAPVHAPTSGWISAIGEITAPHPSGLPQLAITITADGADAWCERLPVADPFALAPEEISRRTAAAGVVGLGGATFPAAVKFNLGRRLQVGTLIVNGGECEPYLSSDDRIMRDRASEVVDGLRIVMHAIGAREALVGIEDNKPQAITAMRAATAAFGHVQVRVVPARYPMGSDKQLIQTLTGKEVPADARAAEVGVLVHNVSTCAAVHRALRRGEPLVERIVTLNGGALTRPGNVLAPIGTPVIDLLRFAGVSERPARLVLGGPMMGIVLPHARVPIVKGASGILAFDAAEARTPAAGPCIRCGSCTRACPMGLLPLEMASRIDVDDLDGAAGFGLSDCIGCGCCTYVCPSHIPLVQYFSYAKGELSARERSRLREAATRRLAEERAARLQREAREKAAAAARRKAERDAAKAGAGGSVPTLRERVVKPTRETAT
ncbi:MAG: electron transport complex subunit RsxC [Candidatus Accumulibacter sp.]|uniref:electron transport complex subunit RsxC n=2 Tax=Accumulibacter sp. TaxID=2053492 RepID=UPI001B20B848|nr:electron transport complex subunit RsxC [Accumulibacter sp.]MBO3709213.1 electron transport complex subunit RsxC [Accumulibacter sp.]